MSDESILGGISEIGGAAFDALNELGEAQMDAYSAIGDTIAEGADRMVAGAAYAVGADGTAQEYRDAAEGWADARSDNLDDASESLSDAGSAVWGNDLPAPEDAGTGNWALPPDIREPNWDDTAGTPQETDWLMGVKPEEAGTGSW